MKLPKCPHCEKLAVGIVMNGILVGSGLPQHEQSIGWLCPEKADHITPDWVEVLEV